MKHGFNLPFLVSTHLKRKPFITMARIDNSLGSTFYQRLYNIYTNIIQAIAKKNYRYINSSIEPALAHHIISEINQVQEQGYKIKVKNPKVKIVTVKPKSKMRKYFSFREKVWKNEITRIGVTCYVYFGQQFNRDQPFVDPARYKQYRIGQFRYLLYDKQNSLFNNMSSWYNHQTYEFNVRYSSKIYLTISSYQQKQPQRQQQDEEIISQIKMRSGNDKFDWLIIDINNMVSQFDK